MKKCLSIFCAFMTFCLMFSNLGISASAAKNYYKINVATHTKSEIAEYFAKNSFEIYADDEFVEEPSCSAPYTYGKLADFTLNNSLNIVNVIRYCAGLQPVRLEPEYYNYCQASCVVNAANGKLSHFPTQPADMPDDFYKDGYKGSSESNISMGYGSLSNSIVYAWNSDGDGFNRTVLGHRRWILYPQMGATAFGSAGRFNSMYVWDDSNTTANETGVAWPAKYTPVQLYDKKSPWSISFSAEYLPNDKEDTVPIKTSNTTVQIECLNDGNMWNIYENGPDGELYIDRVGYGQPLCIIFLPYDELDTSPGQQYKVTINTPLGEISYTVEFFDLENIVPDSESEKDSESDTNTETDSTTEDKKIITDTETENDTYTETDSQTETDTDTETDSQTETDTYTETDSQTETDTYTETDSQTETDTYTETDSQTETDTDTETDNETDTETETDIDTETDTETDTDIDTETDTETDIDTETDTDTDSDTDSDIETDNDIETDSDDCYIDSDDDSDEELLILGDVTGDEEVTLADSLDILRHVLGIETLDDELLFLADVNENYVVNTADAFLVQRYAIGIYLGYDIGVPIN